MRDTTPKKSDYYKMNEEMGKGSKFTPEISKLLDEPKQKESITGLQRSPSPQPQDKQLQIQ